MCWISYTKQRWSPTPRLSFFAKRCDTLRSHVVASLEKQWKSSRYKGFINCISGTFKAQFKTYHLGTYELETDAAMTYDNATVDFKVKGSPYNSIGHGVHSRKNGMIAQAHNKARVDRYVCGEAFGRFSTPMSRPHVFIWSPTLKGAERVVEITNDALRMLKGKS